MRQNKDIHIGEVIRSFRTDQGLTQSELADGICTKDCIYALEHNKAQPSFYILDKLSNRLNVNLFEYYRSISRYNSEDAYNRVLKIHNLINNNQYDDLQPLLEECKEYDDFNYGEAYKVLMYGYAAIEENAGNNEASNKICREIFTHENVEYMSVKNADFFTHTDLLILVLMTINYYAQDDMDNYYAISEILYRQLSQLLNHSFDEMDNQLNFEAHLFITVSYNISLYWLQNEDFKKADEIIEKAFVVGKKTTTFCFFTDLLLSKCILCYYSNRIDEAKSALKDAEIFAKYEDKQPSYDNFMSGAAAAYPLLFV